MVHNLAQSRLFPTLHPFPFTKISKDKDAKQTNACQLFPTCVCLELQTKCSDDNCDSGGAGGSGCCDENNVVVKVFNKRHSRLMPSITSLDRPRGYKRKLCFTSTRHNDSPALRPTFCQNVTHKHLRGYLSLTPPPIHIPLL